MLVFFSGLGSRQGSSGLLYCKGGGCHVRKHNATLMNEQGQYKKASAP